MGILYIIIFSQKTNNCNLSFVRCLLILLINILYFNVRTFVINPPSLKYKIISSQKKTSLLDNLYFIKGLLVNSLTHLHTY